MVQPKDVGTDLKVCPYRLMRNLILYSFIGIMIFGIPSVAYPDSNEQKSLTIADIEGIIKGYLIENTPYVSDQIRIQNITMSAPVVLLPSWDYEILPAPRSPLTGRTSFALNIKSDGKNIQTYWIGTNIEILVDVVLASRTLKDNQIIHEDDIYVSKKVLSEMPAGYINNMKDMAGKRVRRFIGANRPITEDMVEEPPLFRRGDKVFIIAESDALKITAVGIAAEDGIKGRAVKVINMQSRKEVLGEVAEDGAVKVRW